MTSFNTFFVVLNDFLLDKNEIYSHCASNQLLIRQSLSTRVLNKRKEYKWFNKKVRDHRNSLGRFLKEYA